MGVIVESGAGAAGGNGRHAMLPSGPEACVSFERAFKPRLLVIVDAEEEFDWTAPFSRNNTGVKTVAAQSLTEKIFREFGIVPTYVADYPVAAQEQGFRPLRELMEAGRCEIGAQLHPWVTPPHEEEISEANSYASNLPANLERRKVAALTETIEKNFGRRPVVYRAGRYGAGNATQKILEEFGYQIDCSVLPGSSGQPGAPDYSGATAQPYWLNAGHSLLEIPVTVGTVGLAGKSGEQLHGRLISPLGKRLKLPAVAARLRIVDRIRLTPEGSTLDECKRLTRAMVHDGARIFVISYHSPSLVPGHTPYVRTNRDLEIFLGWIKGYLEFFMGEMGGVPSTPLNIRKLAIEHSPGANV